MKKAKPKRSVKRAVEAPAQSQPDRLKGWQQIAAFLSHPAAVAQRWASEGMPVRGEGRYVETTPDELNTWMTTRRNVLMRLRALSPSWEASVLSTYT